MTFMILCKKASLESRNVCTAVKLDRQSASYWFMWFTANLHITCLLYKYLAGAADESTKMHTACCATDDSREVLFLRTYHKLPKICPSVQS
jgi:hypothetical protein